MQQSDELSEMVDDVDTDVTAAADDDSGSGRLGGRFSAKALLVSLVAVGVGVFAGGMIPLVGGITSLVGVAAATFLLGVLGRSWYLETALAGGVVVGVNFALSLLTSLPFVVGVDYFQQYGPVFSAVGVVVGVALAVVGHYFGRDLHDGLTRDI